MYGLTARQRECLEFVADFWRKHLTPPTLREIGEHMGIRSTNGVNDHLIYLARKGMLTFRDGERARAYTVTAKGWAALGVTGCPLCGSCKESAA